MKKNSVDKYLDLGERGKLSKENKLNDLTGKEWIKFTKSWFVHRPPRRKSDERLHPAKFPETLVSEFIRFFTKEGDCVIDPFLGTGSTAVACVESNRNCIGVELVKKYFDVSKRRVDELISASLFKPEVSLYNQDSLGLKNLPIEKRSIQYCITSPPYWNQLERNSIRQKNRKEKNLDTKYSGKKSDLGNCVDYEDFIEKVCKVFDQVFDLVKVNGYLTIIINNIYFQSRLYPLAFDLAVALTKRGSKSWTMKDEKIWLQDDKPLIALGVNNAWVGNRHHQYCLIFRKESSVK
ncbi:MAG: site-specific DNA-methyltransferase [Ignavibacteria bacterium]|nr:site-specific DNA-methyltransferase [Ignavibacteria bacterium]